MIVALSYVIAILLTIVIALVLYPIAAVFWFFGLLGKLSTKIFSLTKKTISYLWKDLKRTSVSNTAQNPVVVASNDSSWVCQCGNSNTGNFCSNCGAPKA